MVIFSSVYWIAFGILYVAWKAHKEYPGTVLIFACVVGGIVSVFALYREIVLGAYSIHEGLAIAIVAVVSVVLIVWAVHRVFAIRKENEPIRITKEVAKSVDAMVPTDRELEEAILDPYFDSFYRTEKTKRMTFLNPESSMYYKKSPITMEKARQNWRRIKIQQGVALRSDRK